MTTSDDRTILQALSLNNDCKKYKMDLTTNGVVITDAIKFVQTNKERLAISAKKKKMKKNPMNLIMHDGEDKDQLEVKQEEEQEK